MEELGFYDSDARIKIRDFLKECSSAKVRLSIETLMEEFKAAVSEKVEFENQGKSKLIAFFRKFWMETNDFPVKSSSASVKVMIQALMENLKPVVAAEKRV